MIFSDTIDTGSMVLSFSNALDLAETSLVKHQERVAFIVWRMCLSGKIAPKEMRNFYMAALFHDVGAFSIKEKKALKTFEFVDETEHCERGYILLKDSFWLSKVAAIVRYHHKSWGEWKRENRGLTNEVVLGAQMVYLADYVERLIDRKRCILHQSEYINKEIQSLAGKKFHSHIVDLFIENAVKEEFWLSLVSENISSVLLKEGPMKGERMRFSVLHPVSELFRKVVDFRSRFTSTHSAGVAAAASKLAEFYGFSKREIEMMEIAGNFHDIGKLAISDQLLEKPYDLDEKEFLMMKSHVFYTYSILKPVEGLEKIAEWAGFHHERLDGSGYPFHLTDEQLDVGARILIIADLFTALIEKRPYKEGMERKEVLDILKKLAQKGKIDLRIFKVLKENYSDIYSFVTKQQRDIIKEYEQNFGS